MIGMKKPDIDCQAFLFVRDIIIILLVYDVNLLNDVIYMINYGNDNGK